MSRLPALARRLARGVGAQEIGRARTFLGGSQRVHWSPTGSGSPSDRFHDMIQYNISSCASFPASPIAFHFLSLFTCHGRPSSQPLCL